MKFKKLNIYIWFIALALSFNACDDTNELTLTEANHRVVYTSEMDFQNKIEVNTDLTFGDVSSGVQSRTWTFPDAEIEIVGSTNNTTSNEANVKAIFNRVGEHNVSLHQVFKGDAYVGNTLKGIELDTIIVVTVLGSVNVGVQANLLNDDGSLGAALNMANDSENEVTASKSVRYTYTVDGEPETFDWTFGGGDPATFDGADEEVNVKYKRMGTYDVEFIAARTRPYGGDTISFKNLIKVIPSTEPVDLEQITNRNGAIALVYSREMDATTLNKEHFSVTIENGGTILNPTISKATVDANEGNIVLLELDNETLFNDDNIKVSYTPGTLLTLDAVAADAFTDEILGFTKINILDVDSDYDYSFENSTADNWPYLWWGSPWDKYSLEISTARAKEGNSSAYIELEPAGGMIMGHKDANNAFVTFPVTAGITYEIGVWVYVEDLGANDPNGFDPDLRFFWGPGTNWGVGGNPTFTSDFKTGEWVYSSTYATFNLTGETQFMIRGFNQANTKALKFYMDEISLSEVSLRP